MNLVTQLSPYGFFIAGLAASGHCALMCGPLIAYSTGGRSAPHSPINRLLTLQAGRVTSYTLLGATAGAFGGQLSTLLSAEMLAGTRILLLAAMLILLLRWALAKPRHHHCPKLAPQTSGQISGYRFFWRGAALALVPCPLLFTVLIYCSLTGSALVGAISMLCFGIASAALTTLAARGLSLWQQRYLTYSRPLAATSLLGLAIVMSVLFVSLGPAFSCF